VNDVGCNLLSRTDVFIDFAWDKCATRWRSTTSLYPIHCFRESLSHYDSHYSFPKFLFITKLWYLARTSSRLTVPRRYASKELWILESAVTDDISCSVVLPISRPLQVQQPLAGIPLFLSQMNPETMMMIMHIQYVAPHSTIKYVSHRQRFPRVWPVIRFISW